eukprot:UN25464
MRTRRKRPAITSKTSEEIYNLHRQNPGVFSFQYLSKTYGMSADEIQTILFKHDLESKYKMFHSRRGCSVQRTKGRGTRQRNGTTSIFNERIFRNNIK